MSMVESPVTHTAEAEVKRASIKLSLWTLAEKGRYRSTAPIRMVYKKLIKSILFGE